MQTQITSNQALLNEKGNVENPGYATKLLWDYNRNSIKASKYKIKEWDYYLIHNDTYAVAMTVADNGYLGFISASVLEFEHPSEITTVVMTPFPLGKFKMPTSSEHGNVHFKNKRVEMNFSVHDDRELNINFKKFYKKETLSGKILLHQDHEDTMVIATPFKKKKAFYYNQKINCMSAEGSLTLGDKVYTFNKENSFAVLDWGRGVWTYKNTWYWGSASGLLNGEKFGFNIGYGFGDTSKATENMIFYKGEAHKLEDVEFIIPDDYLDMWTFSSSDKRFEMTFKPILDRSDETNLFLISSIQHQVFGYFTGTVTLDDGTILELDKFFGFAEKVSNKW